MPYYICSWIWQDRPLVRRSIYHSFRVINSSVSSRIIKHIMAVCRAEEASMAYFYFDFKSVNAKHPHDLISSLLYQLSARSPPCRDILSGLYKAHGSGKTLPFDLALVTCLKQMFSLPGRRPIYIVMDALDECPDTDTSGIPSPRTQVLRLVKELIELSLPNLYICVTSRRKDDIRDAFEPMASHRVILHKQRGQKEDISEYVRFIVYNMRWKKKDKDFVVKTLSERSDGM